MSWLAVAIFTTIAGIRIVVALISVLLLPPNVLASGGLFHTGSRHHHCRRVDLGAAATMMASGDLFHNTTTNHVPTSSDIGAAATRYSDVANGDLFTTLQRIMFLRASDDRGAAATGDNVEILIVSPELNVTCSLTS